MKNNIKKIRELQKLTQKELGNMLGVTDAAIGLWENGKRDPSYETLLKIGEALNCSVSDLMSDTLETRLMATESPIVKKYNALDSYGKKLVNAILDMEYERCTGKAKREKEQKKTKIIPLFGVSFAAGRGEPDTGSAWEDYEVPEDSKGEFAVRITGDSMEPELHDGDIALCKKRYPEMGEIAVVLVNGSFYVKQFITDGINIYLRSLNRKRKDADLDIWASGNDTVKCFGTVIHKRIPLVMQ